MQVEHYINRYVEKDRSDNWVSQNTLLISNQSLEQPIFTRCLIIVVVVILFPE